MADTPLLENRVCFAMYSATNAMVRQYRPRLQVYDLTYPQFIVLLALYEQDNVTLTEGPQMEQEHEPVDLSPPKVSLRRRLDLEQSS